MKILSTFVMILSLAACAGAPWYTGNDQFQSYIAKLHLSQMSAAGAGAKLASLGFVCEPQGDDVSCTRSVDHEFGGQTQHVLISPIAGQGSGVKVKASVSTVVI
jgi:hypothetical protein